MPAGMGFPYKDWCRNSPNWKSRSASFDLALILAAMYSSIPTRERRVEMLQRIKAALKPEGYFVPIYPEILTKNRTAGLSRPERPSPGLPGGNHRHEPGDITRGMGSRIYLRPRASSSRSLGLRV